MLSTMTPSRGGPRELQTETATPRRPLTQHHQLVVQPVLAHLVGGLARVPPSILCANQGDLQDPASCGDMGMEAGAKARKPAPSYGRDLGHITPSPTRHLIWEVGTLPSLPSSPGQGIKQSSEAAVCQAWPGPAL